jgi:hypothetical protein
MRTAVATRIVRAMCLSSGIQVRISFAQKIGLGPSTSPKRNALRVAKFISTTLEWAWRWPKPKATFVLSLTREPKRQTTCRTFNEAIIGPPRRLNSIKVPRYLHRRNKTSIQTTHLGSLFLFKEMAIVAGSHYPKRICSASVITSKSPCFWKTNLLTLVTSPLLTSQRQPLLSWIQPNI